VDHAYVLAGGAMTDRELAYVQLSRSRRSTRIYVDRAELGENFADLARAMTKSRQHTLAHDVVPPSIPQPKAEPAITPGGEPASKPEPHPAPEPLRPEVTR
jgi:hypothetical protein